MNYMYRHIPSTKKVTESKEYIYWFKPSQFGDSWLVIYQENVKLPGETETR